MSNTDIAIDEGIPSNCMRIYECRTCKKRITQDVWVVKIVSDFGYLYFHACSEEHAREIANEFNTLKVDRIHYVYRTWIRLMDPKTVHVTLSLEEPRGAQYKTTQEYCDDVKNVFEGILTGLASSLKICRRVEASFKPLTSKASVIVRGEEDIPPFENWTLIDPDED